jgi:ABC-type polysaccharide/polyol phosphate transport system ATPase subunit
MKERIIVKNVSKMFNVGFRKHRSLFDRTLLFLSGQTSKKLVWVIKKVSFSAKEGEMVGLVGKNGSGKSTLLRMIARIYNKEGGIIKTRGKICPLIGLGVGMQERLTMKDNIYLCGALFGLTRQEIDQKFNPIVEFSELENFVNTKIYQFSSGMKQRLAFSIAIHSNPEILLIDEVFAVGDENFRRKSTERIKELVEKGATVLLVSHDIELIEKHCDRAILLDSGQVLKDGSIREVIKEYLKLK